MNIDRFGRVLAGVAGSGVWLDGLALPVPAESGFPVFLNGAIAYNSGETPSIAAVSYRGVPLEPVDARLGSAPLYSDGDQHYLAFLPGRLLPTRTEPAWGLNVAGAALTMSSDGTAFVTAGPYPDNPVGIAAYLPFRKEPFYTLSAAQPMIGEVAALDRSRLIWADTQRRLQSSGFANPPAQVDESAYFPSMFDLGPRWGVWICYQTQSGRGVCHSYSDASKGFVTGPTPPVYGFTAWIPADGELELCWSNNVGQVGPIMRQSFNVADARPIPPPLSTIPVFTHPIYVAPFFPTK